MAVQLQREYFVQGCENPLKFLQRFLQESVDSPPFNMCISHCLLRESTWILVTLLMRIFAGMNSRILDEILPLNLHHYSPCSNCSLFS